jgi:hypothetical protein
VIAKASVTPVIVVGTDIYGLDADGIGCGI